MDDGGPADVAVVDDDGGRPVLDAPVEGRYMHGIYSCCAKGEERTCCPPETLGDPTTGRTATCFQYGGVLGDCSDTGETVEGKDICALCCPGLERADPCDPTAPVSLFVCIVCGDGVCGPGECTGNCPQDCP